MREGVLPETTGICPACADNMRGRVDEMRGAIEPKRPEPIGGKGPFIVLGDQVEKAKLRGGLAVLETKAHTVVLLDRRAVELAAVALGIELQR
jgi:hypothetical protein